MANRKQDQSRTILRNMMLGMWAAEKLGLGGESAEAYATDLAKRSFEFDQSDVFSKIRKDFDAANVVQPDEEILRVMDDLWLKAGGQGRSTGVNPVDAALVQIARNLQSR